ncbi:hypothetical protein GCM10023187_56340 [Nibrella viscosa]|uniref:Uncharacterized protein n=1 Tax=Nibrella viscosa TaxID=1084524 RepID=A0ABP8L1N1_9BACT
MGRLRDAVYKYPIAGLNTRNSLLRAHQGDKATHEQKRGNETEITKTQRKATSNDKTVIYNKKGRLF